LKVVLTLRKECYLRVFEDRGRGRIFEPEEHEVRKRWNKLYNEELNDQVQDDQMEGTCGLLGRE
jgi:hypothetical protein